MVRGRWSLADKGIVAPNAFVQWQQVSSWHWEGTDILAIALKPGFWGGRMFRIPVAPQAHERTAAILDSKIPT
jgi:hypothetical protein